MNHVNMQVNLGGLIMKNPVTVASGTFGYGAEYNHYFDVSRLGAVTVKSLTLKPRAGNMPPRIVETPAGMLNAIGLQNVGLDTSARAALPARKQLHDHREYLRVQPRGLCGTGAAVRGRGRRRRL